MLFSVIWYLLLLKKVSELFSYIMGAFDHLAQSSETDPSQAIGPK